MKHTHDTAPAQPPEELASETQRMSIRNRVKAFIAPVAVSAVALTAGIASHNDGEIEHPAHANNPVREVAGPESETYKLTPETIKRIAKLAEEFPKGYTVSNEYVPLEKHAEKDPIAAKTAQTQRESVNDLLFSFNTEYLQTIEFATGLTLRMYINYEYGNKNNDDADFRPALLEKNFRTVLATALVTSPDNEFGQAAKRYANKAKSGHLSHEVTAITHMNPKRCINPEELRFEKITTFPHTPDNDKNYVELGPAKVEVLPAGCGTDKKNNYIADERIAGIEMIGAYFEEGHKPSTIYDTIAITRPNDVERVVYHELAHTWMKAEISGEGYQAIECKHGDDAEHKLFVDKFDQTAINALDSVYELEHPNS